MKSLAVNHSSVSGAGTGRVAAILAGVGLIAAAAMGWLVNFSDKGELPHVPLSGLVGPARISELRFAQLLAKGAVSPSLARQAVAAARRDPLAYEPFLFAGAAGFSTERSIGSVHDAALLQEALRRNPRSRQARVLLMRHAVGTGDLRGAIAQLSVLDRLSQANAARLLAALGASITTENQVAEAATAMARYPGLYDPFVAGFASVPKPAALNLALATRLPASVIRRDTVGRQLVDRLARNGDFAGARAVWARMGGRRGRGLVDDPGFAAPKSQPPFGWEFIESLSGVAERQRDGTVFVDYYGRVAGSLLRQLVTLAPGAYRAVLDVEPTAKNSGAIALQVSCATDGRVLARQPIAATRPGRTKLKLPVTIPAGCAGQFVELVGLPLEQRLEQQVIVRWLGVTRGER